MPQAEPQYHFRDVALRHLMPNNKPYDNIAQMRQSVMEPPLKIADYLLSPSEWFLLIVDIQHICTAVIL